MSAKYGVRLFDTRGPVGWFEGADGRPIEADSLEDAARIAAWVQGRGSSSRFLAAPRVDPEDRP